jgi:hypothetical protein
MDVVDIDPTVIGDCVDRVGNDQGGRGAVFSGPPLDKHRRTLYIIYIIFICVKFWLFSGISFLCCLELPKKFVVGGWSRWDGHSALLLTSSGQIDVTK